MYIAAQKKKENIVEYVLYMWQIEDLVRANRMDIASIRENIVERFDISFEQKQEMTKWYQKIVDTMLKEDIVESGHMKSVSDTVDDLNDLHIILINTLEEEKYLELYNWAKPHIKALKARVNNPAMTEIEVCLTGLYLLLMSRLSGKQMTETTMEALSTFSNMLAALALKYRNRQ